MELNNPVFMIKLEGNIKEKASLDKYTLIASFDAISKHTVVFVKAQKLSEGQSKQAARSLKQHFEKYGKVKSVQYYKDGATIIQSVSNN